MSQQWAFYFDAEKCIGCEACTVACKNRNDLGPNDANWRRVVQSGQGTFPDYEEASVSMACMHCANPPCETVCPTGAIEKRDSDGIVTVDRQKCIGCHYCAWSCPYGAPKFDNDNKMQKCHLCLGEGPGEGHGKPSKQTADNGGEKPACVDTCVGDALKAGPLDELAKEATEEAVRQAENRQGNIIVDGALAPLAESND